MGSRELSPQFPTPIEHPLVIIFGAGATKGGLYDWNEQRVSPPVDQDFFDIANQIRGHGTPVYAKKVLKSVWELYRRIHGVGLEEYYRDIETRASVSAIAKTKFRPKDWEKRKQDLEELIRRVFVHTTVDLSQETPKPRVSTLHKAFLGLLKEGSTIITFNYDLVIEESFDSAKLWNPIDGYGVKVYGISHDWCRNWVKGRQYKRGCTSCVHLLKLHGSLGWTLYTTRQIRLKARPYYVRKGKKEKISVLAPGWNKQIGRNPYKVFWKEARSKLESCNSLIIVGYSLPETDLLAKALFAEAIRARVVRKEYIKQLILVDPSNDVKDRFVSMFTPALGPYARISKYSSIEECVLSKRMGENERQSASQTQDR